MYLALEKMSKTRDPDNTIWFVQKSGLDDKLKICVFEN
jgi:hypothetical protein